MSKDSAEQFKRLIKERSEAFQAVEAFAASNYPFTEAQKVEFLTLEDEALAAARAFAELSTFRKI
jgi:hypothetical protein